MSQTTLHVPNRVQSILANSTPVPLDKGTSSPDKSRALRIRPTPLHDPSVSMAPTPRPSLLPANLHHPTIILHLPLSNQYPPPSTTFAVGSGKRQNYLTSLDSAPSPRNRVNRRTSPRSRVLVVKYLSQVHPLRHLRVLSSIRSLGAWED
jgi:hypothetical protein